MIRGHRPPHCRGLDPAPEMQSRFRLREFEYLVTKHSDAECGASLILALVFLIVVGLIVVSIAGLTSADLKVTSAFAASQSTTAAADGAANVAIQSARYNFDGATLNYPAPCNAQQDINVNVQAWCETQWQTGSASTRLVTVSVCLPSSAGTGAGVACAANPLLQAIVVIDDYPTSNSNLSCVPGTSATTPGSTCGSQMILNSWAYNVSPPVVQSIVPAQAVCSPTAITITGTNFTPSSKVAFVSATGYGSNEVLSATGVTVANSYSISATSPKIPVGSGQYYIVVTGLSGPSVFTSTTPSWTC